MNNNSIQNNRELFEALKAQKIFTYKTSQNNSKKEFTLALQKYEDATFPLSQASLDMLSWYDEKKQTLIEEKNAGAELIANAENKPYKPKNTVWVEEIEGQKVFKSKLKLTAEITFSSRLNQSIVELTEEAVKEFNYQAQPAALTKEISTIFEFLNELFETTKKEFQETYDFGPRMREFYEFLDSTLQDLKKPGRQKDDFHTYFNHKIDMYEKKLNETIEVNRLEEKLQFSNYQNTFLEARKLNRKIKVYLGPTNSGKTYAAFESLKLVDKGCYLAPLRLLAHEGVEKLFERGVLSNLMTGEERKTLPGATHTCSTIEMCSLSTPYDCMVIDEIQMLNDPQRGWAWTQALVGAQAKELILVGSPEIMPKLQPILDDLGEEYEIVNFERKQELQMGKSLDSDFSQLERGDCLVVFNRKDALGYKRKLSELGKTCSVVYGNLSPEVRVMEARRFNSGASDIMIATDAIGMGLNLPIKRIFFSKVEKFNGIEQQLIEPSLIKQIAGRAGRYGHTSEPGKVGSLHEEDMNYIKACVDMPYPKSYKDNRCFIQPNAAHIAEICNALKTTKIAPALIFFKDKMVSKSKLFKPSNLDEMIYLAQHIDQIKPSMSIRDAYLYCCAPVDVKHDQNFARFLTWLKKANESQTIECPLPPNGVEKKIANDFNLFEAESFVKIANVYRWLHYHWPQAYNDIEGATKSIEKSSSYIENILSQKAEKIGLHDQRRRSGRRR